MKNEKIKKFMDEINDAHHFFLAQAGAILLLLPVFVPMEQDKEAAMFLAGMVLLAYGVTAGLVAEKDKMNKKINDTKSRQAQMFDKSNSKTR